LEKKRRKTRRSFNCVSVKKGRTRKAHVPGSFADSERRRKERMHKEEREMSGGKGRKKGVRQDTNLGLRGDRSP